jgi:hypothetical protein
MTEYGFAAKELSAEEQPVLTGARLADSHFLDDADELIPAEEVW